MLNKEDYFNEGEGVRFLNFAKDWLKVNPKKVRHPAVYIIGGFYVGSTNNLYKRLLSHTLTAINGKHANKEFINRFNQCLDSGTPMPVKILSRNQKDEKYYINLHRDKLVNKFKPKLSNFNKIIEILKQVKHI